MSPLDPSSPTTVDHEKYNMNEVQNKDFKIPIMNMLKDHKDNMNKSFNEIYKNTNSGMK